MTSLKPNYLPKAHLQIPSHWGLRLQHRNWEVGGEGEGDIIQSISNIPEQLLANFSVKDSMANTVGLVPRWLLLCIHLCCFLYPLKM